MDIVVCSFTSTSQMSSENYPLRHSGIYRNLPNFDPSLKGLNALICGANGISGFNVLRSLLDSPDRWSSIWTVSRRPLSDQQLSIINPGLHSHIKQIQVDLNSPGSEIAQALRESGVHVDYVFYFAYMEPREVGTGMDAEIADIIYDANVPLFENLVEALEAVPISPKRILLQTGGKSYGMHIGRTRNPLVESDPQPRHLCKNFYYGQEDVLKSFCKRHPETGWNIVHPAGVIGMAPRSPINAFYPLAIYAAIQAHKGEPLEFGGDFDAWQWESTHSSARLTGYLSEWAVLEEKCRNQAFNAQDGGILTWDRLYEQLAEWFGVTQGVRVPEDGERRYISKALAGGKDAPLGYGPPVSLRTTFTLADWFRDPSNRDAWQELMDKSSGQLRTNAFDEITPNSIAIEYGYIKGSTLSMNKVRRFGFNGFVDSLESIFEMYQELASAGMLPPMKVGVARPLV